MGRAGRLHVLTTALALAALVHPIGAFSQRVTFRTDDGATIVATWFEPAIRPAPAVILVHMLGRSRHDWDDFASRLSSNGIGALAIDLRGHGDSVLTDAAAAATDYSVMLNDLKAARRFLASRFDGRPSRIGLAGASLGANLAALEAAADPSVASVALLSPSLDYRGLRIEAAVRKIGDRPVLLVSSDDDGYARRSSAELQKTGTKREALNLIGAGHGTNMLSRSEELADALIDWFRRTLQ
jgi:alpha-beta hydrolase superfamily lysophospholipase